MMFLVFVALAYSGACFAAEPKSVVEDTAVAEDSFDQSKVTRGDFLNISVWGYPDLTKTVRVHSDGKISFPFLGDIKVEGFTTAEVRDIITFLLDRDFIVNPHVNVALGQRTIKIHGEIRNAGVYNLGSEMTFSRLVTIAGGFTDFAADDAEIIRKTDKGEDVLPVKDTDKILSGEKPDIPLSTEDVVIIKKRVSQQKVFYIYGEIRGPGSYPISGTITLIRAIALSGGFTDFASSAVEIIRKIDGEEVRLKVNVRDILNDPTEDIVVEPEDVIVVLRRVF